MKRLVSFAVLAGTLAIPALAFAGDSSWLLCKGTGDEGSGKTLTHAHIVLNLLEHRGTQGADASYRDLGVTWLSGDIVSRGAVVGSKAVNFDGKAAALKLTLDKKVIFDGTVMLAGDMKTVTLAGSYDSLFGQEQGADKPIMEKLSAKLTCELLDNQALNH